MATSSPCLPKIDLKLCNARCTSSSRFNPARRTAFGPPAQPIREGARVGKGVQKVGNAAAEGTKLRSQLRAGAPFLDDRARARPRGVGSIEALDHHAGEAARASG